MFIRLIEPRAIDKKQIHTRIAGVVVRGTRVAHHEPLSKLVMDYPVKFYSGVPVKIYHTVTVMDKIVGRRCCNGCKEVWLYWRSLHEVALDVWPIFLITAQRRDEAVGRVVKSAQSVTVGSSAVRPVAVWHEVVQRRDDSQRNGVAKAVVSVFGSA